MMYLLGQMVAFLMAAAFVGFCMGFVMRHLSAGRYRQRSSESLARAKEERDAARGELQGQRSVATELEELQKKLGITC